MLFLFQNFRRIGQEHPASYAPDRIFLDDSDADPYVRGEQQMGHTHTPRPGKFSGRGPVRMTRLLYLRYFALSLSHPSFFL
jgi:hypothetical protein